jgi:hypothetical protein
MYIQESGVRVSRSSGGPWIPISRSFFFRVLEVISLRRSIHCLALDDVKILHVGQIFLVPL